MAMQSCQTSGGGDSARVGEIVLYLSGMNRPHFPRYSGGESYPVSPSSEGLRERSLEGEGIWRAAAWRRSGGAGEGGEGGRGAWRAKESGVRRHGAALEERAK